MNIAAFNVIAYNSYPASGSANKTYSVDAYLVTVKSKSYSVDAVLQATQNRTYNVDALLQGGSSKFYSVDGILASPYHDQNPWGQMIGNNITRPIDPNRVATWSTYSRPANPLDGMVGHNLQTGKIEHYDGKAAAWKDAAGNLV